MNINATLLEENTIYLYKYNCDRYEKEIEHFLTHHENILERQQEAINIIKSIMTKHGKKELLCYIDELARVEHGIQELEPQVRDHVVYALLSFILGIYINEKFLKPLSGILVDDFQWKLAGLFHDVGYPAQVAKDILRPFTAKINEIKRNLGVHSPDVYFKVVPVGLENLTNDLNSFDLIQERLNEWEFRINAREEYDQMVGSGDICHGMVSSLAILYVIDLMYDKYNKKRKKTDIYAVKSNINWNQTYFEKDVVSACSAIYIHNLPNKCFTDAKIDRSKAPVAFLLKLSDCLQEWERPSLKNPKGFSAANFDIKIDKDQLIIHADISDDKKRKIKDEISSSLIAPDVQIC
jgi:hypothetical protein